MPIGKNNMNLVIYRIFFNCFHSITLSLAKRHQRSSSVDSNEFIINLPFCFSVNNMSAFSTHTFNIVFMKYTILYQNNPEWKKILFLYFLATLPYKSFVHTKWLELLFLYLIFCSHFNQNMTHSQSILLNSP